MPCHTQRPCTPVRQGQHARGSTTSSARHRRTITAQLPGPAWPCRIWALPAALPRRGCASLRCPRATLFSRRPPRHALPRRRGRHSAQCPPRRLGPFAAPPGHGAAAAAEASAALSASDAERSAKLRSAESATSPTPHARRRCKLLHAAACRFRRIPRRTPQLFGGPASTLNSAAQRQRAACSSDGLAEGTSWHVMAEACQQRAAAAARRRKPQQRIGIRTRHSRPQRLALLARSRLMLLREQSAAGARCSRQGSALTKVQCRHVRSAPVAVRRTNDVERARRRRLNRSGEASR
ncbi:hypothetical protein FA09DRAFT_355952 [Tilletiopsis washingtonensis]|jgi:hypothetical protein|uniref:Uncharacterized protein n=1 Tax=Tilletiopsis washingtonensis TaxID=58919 RepID=A0A316ZC48_9BASI|nr:hypothetical protein FA09DRAFT_355952 [Tilletiopsis washingtonensis]PWN99357.1 hypothetical protein FA09DRAFT_355952 [Tilletiopsis washingtonensis]